MKGLILLGGTGSRLRPMTISINKHFLPIYDKPVFYYPLSTLMLMGINDIGIVSDKSSIKLFENHLGNGSNYGCKFTYIEQNEALGIADGILSAANFLRDNNFTLILGDNFFYGVGFGQSLTYRKFYNGAKIFGYRVSNPQNYGVIKLVNNKVTEIVEKPKHYISNIAITGLYQFDTRAIDFTEQLVPSERNEFEITDLINKYNTQGSLNFELLPRGTAWLDTGSADSLLEASTFVRVLEQRQGLKIGCIEEIAFRNNWISKKHLLKISSKNISSEYFKYLSTI